jgi:hypothetical protein
MVPPEEEVPMSRTGGFAKFPPGKAIRLRELI